MTTVFEVHVFSFVFFLFTFFNFCKAQIGRTIKIFVLFFFNNLFQIELTNNGILRMLSIREERLQIFVVLNASFNTKYSITHNFKKRKPKLFHLFLNISTPLLQFQLFQCRQCKPDVFEHSIQIFLRDIQ